MSTIPTTAAQSPPATTGGIALRGLTKSYGPVRAVRGVDIAIAPSETVALLGPNGAGKSTAIDMLGRGDEVVAAARQHSADVALLDIEMPGLDGLAAAAALAHEVPGCRVLMLTTFGRAGYLRRSLESGALGFVVKDAPAEQLADASGGSRRASAWSIPSWRRPRSPEGRRRSPAASETCWSRLAAAPPWPTSPPSCSCRRAPSATTYRRRSRRPGSQPYRGRAARRRTRLVVAVRTPCGRSAGTPESAGMRGLVAVGP